MSQTLEPPTLRRRAISSVPRAVPLDLPITVAIAVGAFLIAYDRGGFTLSTRAVAAIIAWWSILLGVGLRLWPRSVISRGAWIVAGLLAAFGVWTLASIAWADNAEAAFVEFNRVAMYLAVFLVVLFAGTRAGIRCWLIGFALAIAAIAVVSLISRCFPSTFSTEGLQTLLPVGETRLSFPVGYWNGLGILVAFGYPLWLALAVRAEAWVARALAIAPFPVFTAVIYLASSRGAAVAAGLGSIVFLLASGRSWTALGALLAVCAASAAVVAVLHARTHLVDGPLRTHAAAAEGHTAFLLVIAIALGTGGAYAVARRLGMNLSPPYRLGRALLGAAAIALILLALALHPVRRFHHFTAVPTVELQAQDSVQSHLLSGSGSGRWQFWAAAVHEWENAPIIGGSAGSYQAWWAKHASFSYSIRNAHSLFLEVLGELGAIGFVLLGAAFGLGAALGVRNTLRRVGEERVVLAALLGVVAAYYFGAAIEWIWQLTAITALGLACLALLIGPAGAPATVSVAGAGSTRRLRVPAFAGPIALLVGAWVLICAQALPWLVDRQLRASASAVARDDGPAALSHALAAKNLQPWAASTYLQLALVEEQSGHLKAAQSWIARGIDRDRADWRLWLVAARIDTKRGNLGAARQSLMRARSLNPRSPLFARIRAD
jgi:O-Antigen ligase